MKLLKGISTTALALAAGIATLLLTLAPANAVVICSSPDLPPGCGEYRTPADVHAAFANPDPAVIEAILMDASHGFFLNPVITPLAGGDELEEFESTLTGIARITPLVGPVQDVPFVLTGPVAVISQGRTGNPTGTFDTEMISMSLSGTVGPFSVTVRESPTQPSPGQTTTTDIGGGLFEIDSFFDIFTEISINGGPFVPQDSPATHVELVIPEPSRALLAMLGFGFVLLRRKK